MTSLIERLRAGARQFQFSGNEEEELAQAATEAADAMEHVLRWLKDPRWGTWPYMEGTGVYEDKGEAIKRLEGTE